MYDTIQVIRFIAELNSYRYLWESKPPSLDITECGSFRISWRSRVLTLSFEFCEDPSDSGWFYVTKMSHGGVREYGDFDSKLDLCDLLTRALATSEDV